MKKFIVLGNPIDHSLSPQIHLEFAKQSNISLTYEKKIVPIDSFDLIISELKQNNFSGANVTLPFKSNAFAIAQDKSKEVRVSLLKKVKKVHLQCLIRKIQSPVKELQD